ncbi:MAG: hypothetical protein ACWA41_04980 [Putridiphycobacter sp.]
MKKITYIFILTVLLTACKKQHTVTIQAQNLTNLLDGSHYAGMNYVVLERGYFFNHKSNGIATGQLDANGRAVIDVKLKKNLDYVLGIQKPDDVCYTEVTIEYPVNYKEENDITFKYAPCGYLRNLSKNVNCEGSSDKMQLKFYYSDNPDIYIYRGFTTGANHEWNDVFYIEGCFDNTNTTDMSAWDIPAGDYTIEWRVIRPSGTTTGIDYFTVTEGDTTTYILEY